MLKKLTLLILLVFSGMQAMSQCACCAGAATGSAFGDINNGVLTLERHQFGAEIYGDYRVMNLENNQEQVNEESEHSHTGGHSHGPGTTVVPEEETLLDDMLITSLGIRYGVTANLMVSALVPYTTLFTENGNDHGMGDLVLTGTYSLVKKATFNVAAIGGIELPTGIQKDASFDNTTVVIGSGSWDPMAGLAISKRWNKWMIYANGLYKFTTNGFDGNYYGDLSVHNLNVIYTLSGNNSCEPGDTTAKSPIGWTVGAGYYGEWLDNITENEVTDVNSGYYLGYATINTKLSFNSWSIPFTFSVPVLQNMNGNQHDAGNRYRAGVVKTF